jgi:hypothetical protein
VAAIDIVGRGGISLDFAEMAFRMKVINKILAHRTQNTILNLKEEL